MLPFYSPTLEEAEEIQTLDFEGLDNLQEVKTDGAENVLKFDLRVHSMKKIYYLHYLLFRKNGIWSIDFVFWCVSDVFEVFIIEVQD